MRKKEPMMMTDDQRVVSVEPWVFGEGPNSHTPVRAESVCDFGITPSIPQDHKSFRVLKHDRFGGKKVVRFLDGKLYVDELQVVSGIINVQRQLNVEGFRINSLIRRDGHCLANANFVDFLKFHPELFPNNHKADGHCLVSWGTVYHDLISGRDCLKAIRWNKDRACVEGVTKSLFDFFCDKCFYIAFA